VAAVYPTEGVGDEGEKSGGDHGDLVDDDGVNRLHVGKSDLIEVDEGGEGGVSRANHQLRVYGRASNLLGGNTC